GSPSGLVGSESVAVVDDAAGAVLFLLLLVGDDLGLLGLAGDGFGVLLVAALGHRVLLVVLGVSYAMSDRTVRTRGMRPAGQWFETGMRIGWIGWNTSEAISRAYAKGSTGI